MPANPWEIAEAEEEGFTSTSWPRRSGSKELRVSRNLCANPWSSVLPTTVGVPARYLGLRPHRPPADTVISAVGQRPDFTPFLGAPGLAFNRWDYLECNEHTLMTDRPGSSSAATPSPEEVW